MSINVFACGDIVNNSGKKDFVDKRMMSLIRSCDLSLCNFEAPIKTESMKGIKKAGPHLSQSKESVSLIKHVGFNFASLANNHIYDYGDDTLRQTINELNKHGIAYIGAGNNFKDAYSVKYFEKEDIKIGLLAGCENEFGCLPEEVNRGGYAWLFHELIEDNIRELKQHVDIIILVAHAGVEEIDFPIKEWRDRYRRLCSVGVDVIIGHHPHVPQGYETYNNSMIFYSLGNFYFDTTGYKDKENDSYSVVLEFEKKGLLDFTIVYHKKVNNMTTKVEAEDVNFSIHTLNSLLGHGYEASNNEMCLTLFHKYYYNYYKNSFSYIPSEKNILEIIIHMIKKTLSNKKKIDQNNLMLLHNIRIDSHRFVVQRALSLISEQNGDHLNNAYE